MIFHVLIHMCKEQHVQLCILFTFFWVSQHSYAQFTPPARHDKTVLSVSRQVVWIANMQQLSRPQRVHILRGVQRRCVWAVWRLGLHCSCLPGLRHGGDGRRGTIFCRWQSWVFENPILTAEADTTETGLFCRVLPGGVNWVQCY